MVPKRGYYRVMAGTGSVYYHQWLEEGFIAGYWGIDDDLSSSLPYDWREFNQQFKPVYLSANPGKTAGAAGLFCGMLHTMCKGMVIGDVVLMPDGNGNYHVGEVISDYFFKANDPQPHRRKIKWYSQKLHRENMSEALKKSSGSSCAVCNITKHFVEMEKLLAGEFSFLFTNDGDIVEDPVAFALEKHLEDFLIANWKFTVLGKDYDIYTVDGDITGRQFYTDTGNMDILAISKDKKTLLVVELKKGRASDAVVGQIQRYMGYVKNAIAEKDQRVKGAIIAFEDDLRIRRAISVAPDIDFYRYQVRFKLIAQ